MQAAVIFKFLKHVFISYPSLLAKPTEIVGLCCDKHEMVGRFKMSEPGFWDCGISEVNLIKSAL